MQFGDGNAIQAVRAAVEAGALQTASGAAVKLYVVLAGMQPPDAAFIQVSKERLAKWAGLDTRSTRHAVEAMEAALDELMARNLVVREWTPGEAWKLSLISQVELIDRVKFAPWSLIRGDAQAEQDVRDLTEGFIAVGDTAEAAEAKAIRQVARRMAELAGERNLFGA